MNYALIQAIEIDELENRVNDEIKNGYEPLGGISTSTLKNGEIYYCQAMIKK